MFARRDAQNAQRALAQLRVGKLRTVSHAALKRELGASTYFA